MQRVQGHDMVSLLLDLDWNAKSSLEFTKENHKNRFSPPTANRAAWNIYFGCYNDTGCMFCVPSLTSLFPTRKTSCFCRQLPHRDPVASSLFAKKKKLFVTLFLYLIWSKNKEIPKTNYKEFLSIFVQFWGVADWRITIHQYQEPMAS